MSNENPRSTPIQGHLAGAGAGAAGCETPVPRSKIVQAAEVLQMHCSRWVEITCILRDRLNTAIGAVPENEPTPLQASDSTKEPRLPDIDNLFIAIESVEREYNRLVVQLERITPLTGE